jgi:hypothetical protein
MGVTVMHKRDLAGVNWQEMKSILKADDFDNGRTPEPHSITRKLCLP